MRWTVKLIFLIFILLHCTFLKKKCDARIQTIIYSNSNHFDLRKNVCSELVKLYSCSVSKMIIIVKSSRNYIQLQPDLVNSKLFYFINIFSLVNDSMSLGCFYDLLANLLNHLGSEELYINHILKIEQKNLKIISFVLLRY